MGCTGVFGEAASFDGLAELKSGIVETWILALPSSEVPVLPAVSVYTQVPSAFTVRVPLLSFLTHEPSAAVLILFVSCVILQEPSAATAIFLPLTVAVQAPSGLTFASSRPLASEPEPEPLFAEADDSAAPLLESEPLELSAVDSVLSLSADALESAAPEELALLLELALLDAEDDAEELALLLELLEADPPPQALSASTPAKARESRAGAFLYFIEGPFGSVYRCVSPPQTLIPTYVEPA